MFDNKIDLRALLLKHQEKLVTDLGSRDVFEHPTAKGDIGEGAWHSLLGDFLPRRYQVSKAFVMDARGTRSEQLDLVIHDRHFCPLLFEKDGQMYIPAESVFAVFEVRPSLDKEVVDYASKKTASVRSLHRTNRTLIDRGVEKPARDEFRILAGVLTVDSSWSPPFGAPLEAALAAADQNGQLDLGCTAKAGAFEVVYEGSSPRLELSETDGGVMFFLLRLFHALQQIGSPMGIDLREYSRPIQEGEPGDEASR